MPEKLPDAHDLRAAADWLRIQPGSEAEKLANADACRRVRAWLLQQAAELELLAASHVAGTHLAQARKAAKLARAQGLAWPEKTS